jgi:hypothetical protein
VKGLEMRRKTADVVIGLLLSLTVPGLIGLALAMTAQLVMQR